jgi:hypothetical protein
VEIFIKISRDDDVCSFKIWASLTRKSCREIRKIDNFQVLLEISFWIASNGNELYSLSVCRHNDIAFGVLHP